MISNRAIVDELVNPRYNEANQQPERQPRNREVREAQQARTHRRRLTAYHDRDAEFQCQQARRIVHQAFAFEDIHDALRQSNAFSDGGCGNGVGRGHHCSQDEA